MTGMAKILVVIGLLLIALGLTWQFAPQWLNWFGKLPGDIRYESGRTRVFIPISSMLIVSIVISVLLALFRR